MRSITHKSFIAASAVAGALAVPTLLIPEFYSSVRASFRAVVSPGAVRADALEKRAVRTAEMKDQLGRLSDVSVNRPGQAGQDAKHAEQECLSDFRRENRLDPQAQLQPDGEGKVRVQFETANSYQYHQVTLDLPTCVRARLIDIQKDNEREPVSSAAYAIGGGVMLLLYSVLAGTGAVVSGVAADRFLRRRRRPSPEQSAAPS